MVQQARPRTVPYTEQVNDGLVRSDPRGRFVAAQSQREKPAIPINTDISHTIDVPPVSTQHIEVRTSATDRAKGFLLASVPLCMAFALAVLAVAVLGFGVPLYSLPALVIVWLSFVAAWLLGYGYTLHVSAEGVALYEARSKWDVIRAEQEYRWRNYERQLYED